MQHTCLDCGTQFFSPGESSPPMTTPAAQCPSCQSYRTQPGGIPDEENDMLNGIGAMPNQDQLEDMSGNPLQEGILGHEGGDGGWQNRMKRDESFASVRKRAMDEGEEPWEPSSDAGQVHILPKSRSSNGRHQVMVIDANGMSQWPTQYAEGRYGWDNPEAVMTPTHIVDQAFDHARRLDQIPSNGQPSEDYMIPYYDPQRPEVMPLQPHQQDRQDLLTHPDPMMDNEPGSLTLPEHWGRTTLSLFETPEFETEQLVLPPDLYRHAMDTEAAHRTSVQIPKGITDNLHAALGNLQAWTENPYENGELRPYYNKYWQVIRPSFMKPGSLQIGVADPTMAEIINHVAQTDDLTPLYEYRGENTHTSGFIPAIGEAAAGLLGAGAGDAAAGAAATDAAGASASGVGGLMQKVMGGGAWEAGKAGMGQVLGLGDDLAGGAAGTQQGGQSGPGGVPGSVNSPNFYAGGVHSASDEDSLSPEVNNRIPNQDNDGDSDQKADGDHKHWQKDYSVNEGGGTDQGGPKGPTFDMNGAGMERFKMLLPLIQQFIESGEDGSQDPLIQGLHQTLDAEIPGYLDHADDNAAHELLLVLGPNGKPEVGDKPSPEKNDEDHTDENSGGKHESRTASLQLGQAEGGDFLADLDLTFPSLNGVRLADTQGPTTPEQIQAVQQWLMDHGREMGLEGDELTQTILSVPTNPLEFADILAQITKRDPPPPPPDAQTPAPPQPAQEQAPPGDTMPMPGMDSPQPTMSHVNQGKVAADNIAARCPKCKSHTTKLINGEDGTSMCHACKHVFKTKGVIQQKIESAWMQPDSNATWNGTFTTNATASTWNVDKDFRKEADIERGSDTPDVDSAPVQGVPIADQTRQDDGHREQDSGHTWTDEDGNPLKVGQEYEMYSDKYEIPDLVRIEAVKPHSIVYTLMGEFGLHQTAELTKEEANIDRTSFQATQGAPQPGVDDGLEENNDDNDGYSGEPEQTDMSAPWGQAPTTASRIERSVLASGVERENPALAWLNPRTAGANYTPMEQRALIDERGSARNADMLNLSGTHYVQDAEDEQFLFGL